MKTIRCDGTKTRQDFSRPSHMVENLKCIEASLLHTANCPKQGYPPKNYIVTYSYYVCLELAVRIFIVAYVVTVMHMHVHTRVHAVLVPLIVPHTTYAVE